MLVADLDTATLGRVRLAPSPAHEAGCWLRLARDHARHPVFGDPGPRARWALRDPDVALVASLLPTPRVGYEPDLLTPKPPAETADRFTLTAQLDRIEQTDDADVEMQVAQLRFGAEPMPPAVRQAIDDGTLATRAASGVQTFWRCALADEWPHLRRRLDADVAQRGAALAARGVGETLNSLHERVTWTGTQLRVENRYEEHVAFHDAELVLVPSALGWPGVATQIDDPDNAMLAYPAAGIGQVAHHATPASFGRLLGATRTLVLRHLDAPRSTTELSAELDLAISTVSYHLSVLLRTGLVGRRRQRRVVHYHRTQQGDALLDVGAAATS